MSTYHFIKNHLIAELDGKKCLIDSGSPVSFGEGELEINGKIHQLEGKNQLGVNLDEIASHVGTEIDVLIGGDILSQYPGLFVWLKKDELQFDNLMGDEGYPFELWRNIPLISLEVNGQMVRAYVDTGAQQSYIDENLAQNLPRIGEVTDFYPGYGEMTVSLVSASYTDLSGAPATLNFGILPNELTRLLAMADCQIILGLDWLKNGDKEYFQINYQDEKFLNK